MQSLSAIPWLRAPTLDARLPTYVESRRPVALQGLLAGQPISEMWSQESALSVLGDMVIKTRQSYTDHLFCGSSAGVVEIVEETLSDYFGPDRRGVPNPRACLEYDAPPELRQQFYWPEVAGGGDAVDTLCQLFVSKRGSVRQMHFDADHRHFLLYCVFGHTRVVVVPPDRGRRLLPCSATSLLPFSHWAESERRDLFAYVGASTAVLRPGQAVFVPALWWYHVETLESGMSVSMRFGRNEVGRRLSGRVFPEYYLQNVGALFSRQGAPDVPRWQAIAAIADAPYKHPLLKHRAMQAMLEIVFRELGGEDGQAPQRARVFAEMEDRAAADFYRHVSVHGVGSVPEGWRQ